MLTYIVDCILIEVSLLCEVPGGNQVDGLPPVASNNATGGIAGNVWSKHIYGTGALQSQIAPDLELRIS